MRGARFLGLLFGFISCLSVTQGFASEEVKPVSSKGFQSISASGNSHLPALTADGNHLLFLSDAMNLVTNDDSSRFLDVFLRDLVASNTILISVNGSGVGGGDASSVLPAASSNGQFVAFQSSASNLTTNDTNRLNDVFLRDVAAGTTELASIRYSGDGSGNGPSGNPSLSADGRWVAFESSASDLVTNDTNGSQDIFVRDHLDQRTILVSVDFEGKASSSGRSDSPVITADGRFVLFFSTATNLVPKMPDPVNPYGDLYLRDLAQSRTICISSNVFGLVHSSYSVTNWTVSADGRFAVFRVQLPTDITTLWESTLILLKYQIEEDRAEIVSPKTLRRSDVLVAPDGRYIVYSETNGIVIFDTDFGTDYLAAEAIERCGIEGGIGFNMEILTVEGFSGDASVLSYRELPCDSLRSALHIRSIQSGDDVFVNVRTNGDISPLTANISSLSPDGHTLAFESSDGALVANDFNLASDVMIYRWPDRLMDIASQPVASRLPSTGPALSSSIAGDSISADGKRIIFSSFDFSYYPASSNRVADLFIKDFGANTIQSVTGLKSYPTNAWGPLTNLMPVDAHISADGKFAVFAWQDTTGYLERESIFLRDLELSQTFAVSANDVGSYANWGSAHPAISRDGRLIAFQSANRLILGFGFVLNGNWAIIVRPTGTNGYFGDTNRLNPVSINLSGSDTGNRDSIVPIISPDDRWVLFYSQATDLTTNIVSSNYFRLYGRDLRVRQTRLFSNDQFGAPIDDSVTNAIISDDSRYVFFQTINSPAIHRCELLSIFPTSTVICTNCSNPSIGADGRFVTFLSQGVGSTVRDVFVEDLNTGQSSLMSLSVTGNGGANSDCNSPQISGDGRYVVFASKSSNLVENDTNGVSDIFVRDRVLGLTLLVSKSLLGPGSGNAVSSQPVMGMDGRTVVFQSFASDLIAGDYNSTRDVFVLKLPGIDSDHDGMDDEWEMAFFNTLERDGSGDFDSDGQSDLQEFLTGTDPTNGGSILRVLTLTSLSGTAPTLLWNAVPGRTYTVQFKDSVEAESWTNLPTNVRAISTTASIQDNSTGSQPHRFYRVVLVQ